jgi:hypothetical protein
VIVETKKYGKVAILPVGMSQISSVVFEDAVKAGAQVHKGDMLGTFLFGGLWALPGPVLAGGAMQLALHGLPFFVAAAYGVFGLVAAGRKE